jgi:hypothetical protein
MPCRVRAAGIAAIVLTAFASLRADDTTIGAVLREAGVVLKPALRATLQNEIVSNGADLSDDRDFIYAGWSMKGGQFDTLHVFAVNRPTGAWTHRTYTSRDGGNDAAFVGGSILEVRASRRFVSLDMHHSPSAGTTWVLRRDLSKAGVFYGWIKEWLPNDLMIYEHSQIHFAPTHSLEVAIYDPVTAQSRSIYPVSVGSEVRRAFVARVKTRWDALGEDWFRTHNHHGDPERFDSSSGQFVVDWQSRALAFEVRFEDFTGTNDGRSAQTERIIATCEGLERATTVRCGETLESAWADRFPGRGAEDLLREAAARPQLVPWK